MFESLNSIDDNALFGSGVCNNQTELTDARFDRCPSVHSEMPQSQCGAFLNNREHGNVGAAATSSNLIHIPFERQGVPQPVSVIEKPEVRIGHEYLGARRKEVKNKENKNKNGEMRLRMQMGNAENAGSPMNNSSSKGNFVPKLQVKRYDLPAANGYVKEDNVRKAARVRSGENVLGLRNEYSPESVNSSGSLSDSSSIPTPALFDSPPNFQIGTNVKSSYCASKSSPGKHSITVVNGKKVKKPDNIVASSKTNDLLARGGSSSDRNRPTNIDVSGFSGTETSEVGRCTPNRFTLPQSNSKPGQLQDRDEDEFHVFSYSSLEMDSEPPNNGGTVVKLVMPRSNVTNVNSNLLENRSSHPSIVAHYMRQSRSSSDSSLHLTENRLSQGSLENSPESSINFVPTSTFAATPNGYPYVSNALPSNALFGDGTYGGSNAHSMTDDSLYARSLQRHYDEESYFLANKLDDFPVFEPQFSTEEVNSDDEHEISPQNFTRSQPLSNFRSAENLRRFQTADPSGNQNVSSVYDTNNEENESRISNPQDLSRNTYVTCERLSSERPYPAETVSFTRPDITIPVTTMPSNVQEPCVTSVPEPIRITHDTQPVSSPQPEEGGHQTVISLFRELDEDLARRTQEAMDAELAQQLQEDEDSTAIRHGDDIPGNFHMRHMDRPLFVRGFGSRSNENVADAYMNSRGRPLFTFRNHWSDDDPYGMLDSVHNVPGYDMLPDDYYLPYGDDDDGDDRLVSINQDPHLLARLLMHRSPNMMIPRHVDLNDYEALWELAENLGEVRRVGMDSLEISQLPVHTYQPSASADEKTDCLVCMEEYQSGDRLKTLPCHHMYHAQCIDEWLRRNAICPICRQSAKQ